MAAAYPTTSGLEPPKSPSVKILVNIIRNRVQMRKIDLKIRDLLFLKNEEFGLGSGEKKVVVDIITLITKLDRSHLFNLFMSHLVKEADVYGEQPDETFSVTMVDILYDKKITWARLVMALDYTSELVLHAIEDGKHDMVFVIVTWCEMMFRMHHFDAWVDAMGGWANMPKLEMRDMEEFLARGREVEEELREQLENVNRQIQQLQENIAYSKAHASVPSSPVPSSSPQPMIQTPPRSGRTIPLRSTQESPIRSTRLSPERPAPLVAGSLRPAPSSPGSGAPPAKKLKLPSTTYQKALSHTPMALVPRMTMDLVEPDKRAAMQSILAELDRLQEVINLRIQEIKRFFIQKSGVTQREIENPRLAGRLSKTIIQTMNQRALSGGIGPLVPAPTGQREAEEMRNALHTMSQIDELSHVAESRARTRLSNIPPESTTNIRERLAVVNQQIEELENRIKDTTEELDQDRQFRQAMSDLVIRSPSGSVHEADSPSRRGRQ